MNYQLFSTQALLQQLYTGPLVPHLDAFAAVLSGQGYSKLTTKVKIRAISKFSQWLQKQHFVIEDINESCINKFIRYRKKRNLRGKDGRDLVFCQSHTFNQFFPTVLKQGRLLFTSSNGFKVWAGGPEKWWTEIHLRSAGLKPVDDRSGYVFESPEGTYPSLAINGQLTDEELRSLVDSLMPSKKVLELSNTIK